MHKLFKQKTKLLILFLISFACLVDETDAVRRVLRGRRTLTRRYFNGLAIPGWTLVLLIALAELLLGAILYAVLHKVILGKEVELANTYTPAATSEV